MSNLMISWTEQSAYQSFNTVTRNFSRNHKAENYREMVSDILKNYKTMGCNMSLKIHFLGSHWGFSLKT